MKIHQGGVLGCLSSVRPFSRVILSAAKDLLSSLLNVKKE